MVSVTLGTTSDRNNKVNKTVLYDSPISCDIIYPCSMQTPTLKLNGTITGYNYVSGIFGRKYYITDRSFDKGYTYLHLTTDVVSSFPVTSTQFVSRSENYGNKIIPDNLMPLDIQKIPCVSVFGDNVRTDESFIVGLI